MRVETSGTRLQSPDGETLPRIVGFETEYAFNARATEASVLLGYGHETADLALPPPTHERIIADANATLTRQILKFAYPKTANQFQATGQRNYLDLNHPEEAGPEHIDYLQAAYGLLAGHIRMARHLQAASRVVAQYTEFPIEAIDLFANTCNPGAQNENSWSSHLSFLARRELEQSSYILPLATHHAARIVWSGAGTVIDKHDKKAHLGLSEKANFMYEVFGNSTTHYRALVNLRDEPLADRSLYRRIHDISGETVFSPLANALRASLDSLILRAVEAGESFSDLLLENPVGAMRQISEDITLTKKYRLAAGGYATAIGLEMAMIERALTVAVEAENVTTQEIDLAQRAVDLLTKLQADPMSCGRWVDWVVKHKSIDKDLQGKSRTNGESDLTIAAQKSAQYHRLLETEGVGMRMIRRGGFEASPSAEVLENGPSIPLTRARLRAYLIGQLINNNVEFVQFHGQTNSRFADDNDGEGGGWVGIYLPRYSKSFTMLDPYESDTTRADEFLDQIAA